MSDRPRRQKMLTREEIDAIDPALIDSVTGDRLLATVRMLLEGREFLSKQYAAFVHHKVALWLASEQDDLTEAASWFIADVEEWLDWKDIAANPWAHDWRKFWASRDHLDATDATPCAICGDPSTIWSGPADARQAACGDRHWKALRGELPDEQCRLCNKVVVCAHDLDGSPVCADCWPGERLLAERRRQWSARFTLPT